MLRFCSKFSFFRSRLAYMVTEARLQSKFAVLTHHLAILDSVLTKLDSLDKLVQFSGHLLGPHFVLLFINSCLQMFRKSRKIAIKFTLFFCAFLQHLKTVLILIKDCLIS